VVTLLTDYGLSDGFAGVLHGVIAGICPQARIIDLTHGIPRQDVLAGALVLAGAIRYMPVGVHLAIVDPDVGSARRAIALASGDGRLFVGPDNGVMWPAVQACGGAIEAVEISGSPLRLQPVSATFHGRDIFAPVAAQLAAGVALGAAGSQVPAGELVALELPRARVVDGTLLAHAVYIDVFENVQLDATGDDLEALGVTLGQSVELEIERARGVTATARYARTFADARRDALIVFVDSSRRLALAVNHGSAAARLHLEANDVVRISTSAS
jgi:hypothetical protein